MICHRILIEEIWFIDSITLNTKGLAFLKIWAAESQGEKITGFTGLCIRAYPQLAGSPSSPGPWFCFLSPVPGGKVPESVRLRQSLPWDWKVVGSGIPAGFQILARKPRKYQLNMRFSLEYLDDPAQLLMKAMLFPVL